MPRASDTSIGLSDCFASSRTGTRNPKKHLLTSFRLLLLLQLQLLLTLLLLLLPLQKRLLKTLLLKALLLFLVLLLKHLGMEMLLRRRRHLLRSTLRWSVLHLILASRRLRQRRLRAISVALCLVGLRYRWADGVVCEVLHRKIMRPGRLPSQGLHWLHLLGTSADKRTRCNCGRLRLCPQPHTTRMAAPAFEILLAWEWTLVPWAWKSTSQRTAYSR